MDPLNAVVASLPSAYHWPVKFCAFSTVATWVISIITSNVSQVDRVWTFLPTIYTAYYALLPLWPQEPLFFLCPYTPKSLGWAAVKDFSPRAVLLLALVFLWMCRLSYNAYRRDFFTLAGEDYRWAVLRSQLPPWLFQVVNLTFIAATQNVLLLLLGYPAKVASLQPHTPLSMSDAISAALAVAILLIEFTCDNQQYSFQAYKRAYLATKNGEKNVEPYDPKKQWIGSRLNWTPEDAERGFITKGRWAYSRHPNFACEQSFWWIINIMPLASPSPPHLATVGVLYSLLPSPSTALHAFPKSLYPFFQALLESYYHIGPALCLSLLFFSSTLYTESISMGKYPAYKAYQERVGMFGGSLTPFKGLWLMWTGRKAQIDALLWGSGEKPKKE